MRWDDSDFDGRRMTGRLGIWEKDLTTGTVTWSADVADMLGLRALPPSLDSLLVPVVAEDRELVANALHRSVLASMEHYHIEYRCVRPDGAEIQVRNEWGVECDASGAPTTMRGVIQDVTYRKQTKAALHRQTALLSMLYEVAKHANEARTVEAALSAVLEKICAFAGWPVGQVFVVKDGELEPTLVYYASERARFEALRAAWREARPGLTSTPAWSPDIVRHAPAPVAAAALDAGLRAVLDLPVLVGAETVAVIECFSEEDRAPDLGLLQAMGHVAAQLGRVFERKRGEDRLRQSEARLRQILDSMPIAVFVMDRVGRHYFHNQHALALSPTGAGKSFDPTRGLDRMTEHFDVYLAGSEQNYPSARNPLIRALSGERSVIDDAEILVDGRRVPIEVWGAPVFDDSDRVAYALAAFHDISERKKVERLKDEFVSTVSHELRTPLTSILGAMTLLENGVLGALPKEALELVQIAGEGCRRLHRLVDELLDVQKLESDRGSLHAEPMAIAPILEDALKASAPHAATLGVTLSLCDEAPGAEVQADRDRLVQVATNLLSNAIRYSPRGERVIVRIARAPSGVRVTVEDRGPGVTPEFQVRLFQKFSQADASDARHKTGTGLGLAISKRIVENLGGTIGYEPNPGGGACFHFELRGA